MNLTGEDIFAEKYISTTSQDYIEAGRRITHYREQERLGRDLTAEDQEIFDESKEITKTARWQRSRLLAINTKVDEFLAEDDTGGDTGGDSFDTAEEAEDSDDGTIQHSSDDSDDSDDSHDSHGSGDSDGSNPPNVAAMPHAAAHQGCTYPRPNPEHENGNEPRGNEVQLIPEFSGDGSADPEIWIRRVKLVANMYGWRKGRWQSAASTKFSGIALKWLEALTRKLEFPFPHLHVNVAQGPCHGLEPQGGGDPLEEPALPAVDSWAAFERAFLRRFKPQDEAIAATEAIMDLKQTVNESVGSFFDRCVIAVDKKNFTIRDKSTDEYRTARDADLFSFLAAGVKPEIRKMALGGQRPAQNIGDLLAFCMNSEVILKAQQKAANEIRVNEVNQGRDDAPPASSNDPKELSVQELKKEIDALRSNMKCFKCGEFGHMRRECKSKAQSTNSNAINRSGGGNQRRGNRGRGRGGGGGRNRGGGGNPRNPGGWRGGRNNSHNNPTWQRGWVPQANFGQPGSYYQNNMMSYAPGFGPPHGAMSTSSGSSRNSNSINCEPWALAGNE